MLDNKFIENIKFEYPKVNVIAVTKYVDYLGVIAFKNIGMLNIGENRVESFLDKYEKVDGVVWHFIGSLQTKKVKKIIDKIDYLHSLDRLSLALEIEKRAKKTVKCFIQVKTSDEETKHGLAVDEVGDFINEVSKLKNIEIVGFMTMAPETNDEVVLRKCFSEMRKLKDKYPYEELSMGMSNDYKIAIDHGATYVRLGRILYERG
ncbi:YggS family pyridoxal phosphate-dependent enzyme [Mycoplasmatota bacterium]|nr:YggS family pyridoxal phosphate-dependent enzyme [Mycoplasmatota bacterium]